MTAKPATPTPRTKGKKAAAAKAGGGADELARIMGRAAFDQHLAQEWERAKEPLSLLIIDVDGFAAYNASHPAPKGDECLGQIAVLLARAVFRPTDLVARYGEDEFAILLPSVHEGGARVVAARVRSLVNELAIPHRAGEGGILTVSIGVAALTPTGEGGPQTLVDLCEGALAQAKRIGGDSIVSQDWIA